MSDEDRKVWDSYARGVARTAKRKSPAAKTRRSETASVAPLPKQTKTPPPQKPAAIPEDISLERRREKALRDGSLSLDATLDLHGMVQAEAFAALADFMQRAARGGKRHLLVVTGKGKGGMGVLRRNLRDWLASLPQAKSILAIRPAAPKHGGGGAFYVLMRRK
ncbi:MAG: Smr/MutS family protein [Alphaproteobacteria bacterium]|nr:Smr/MutS family protein [Alphaproteobacteria bacterium]